MEVFLILLAVYIVWRILKYFISSFIWVNQLYHALKDIRITTFQNKELIAKIFNIDFDEREDEIKRAIGVIIIAALKDNGYHIEYIQGNYKLSVALAEAINDIYLIIKEKQYYIDVFED